MHVRCDRCDELHDISEVEPSLRRPDAYLAVPEADRQRRTRESHDFCAVWGEGGASHRWFVRVLVAVPVYGQADPCCWGIWCEVSGDDFQKITALWNDPDQCGAPPFPARLANDLEGYPPTSALNGQIRFVDPKKIPFFEFAPGTVHPFAEEARLGVPPSRVLEWLEPWLHAKQT